MNMMSQENLAVGQGDMNLTLRAFQLMARVTEMTCQKCINLLEGDYTYLAFRRELLHYFQ